jgi:uncharacterized membrane protein
VATTTSTTNPGLAYRPGLVLGIGLGAFVDGILFHQVLRWHHFISDTPGQDTTTVDGLNANTLADGLFHAVSWCVLVAGVILMWRSAQAGAVPQGRVLAGSLLTGAGFFNLFDAVGSHWVLGLHHIHEGSYETLSDVVYFVVAVLMTVAGLALSRRRRTASAGAT